MMCRTMSPRLQDSAVPHARQYHIAASLIRLLPRNLCYWLGLRIADVYYFRDRRGRAAVETNIARIFKYRGIRDPGGSIRRKTRKTYQYFGKYLVDFFRMSQHRMERLDRWVSIRNMEYLEKEFARGRGVIIATAHLGNWELGAMVLSGRGYPITAVFRPFGVPHLDRLFTEKRESRGVKLVPLGQSVRPLMTALKAGECVALLVDRDFSGTAKQWPFFGVPAPLPDGAARLSWKTGVPIVPGFVTRRVDDSFLLTIHPPIHPEDYADVDGVQTALIHSVEAAIGEEPYQWFLFEDYCDATEDGDADVKSPSPKPAPGE